jgi:hypothetical protein
MDEKNQQQGQEAPLGVYPISFEIYAHSPQEAEEARMAIIAFIGLHARQGRAVTGEKIAKAVANWDKNPIVRSKVIRYFEE